MRSKALRLLSRISRRRPFCSSVSDNDDVNFKKCLSTYDLVALGVGSCCGTGMYLTVGLVAKEMAGPGAVIAFIVAGIGSLLSGTCYAELASSCPRTSGSAYMYSYVTVGELVAYVIGWGLIVEYVIGAAAGAVALSATVDSIFNFALSEMPELHFPVGGRSYFDFVAIAVCLSLTFILAYGVELSTTVNNVLTCVNAVVWVFFIGASASFAQPSIWTTHGFFPFGAKGVVRALPIAYFAFIGFDTVASSGQEARDPEKSIPKSILYSVIINTAAFSTVTLCLTLVLPYFSLQANTAMVDVFGQRGAPLAKYVISVGAVCALFAATFGSLFPLPRVLYAMADDGLIFKRFAKLCPKRKTPKFATLIGGLVATLLAVTTNLNMLIELVLIGTLMAYVLVAVCVLLLRYRKTVDKKPSEPDLLRNHYPDPEIDEKTGIELDTGSDELDTGSDMILNGGSISVDDIKEKFPSWMTDSPMSSADAPLPEVPQDSVIKIEDAKQRCYKMLHHFRDSRFLLTMLLACEVGISVVFAKFFDELMLVNVLLLTLTGVLLVIFLICFCVLLRCPQTGAVTTFRSPCVPLLPVGVTFFNIYLMVSLSATTWCAFAVWMVIGFLIYFFYGIKRSKLEKQQVLILK